MARPRKPIETQTGNLKTDYKKRREIEERSIKHKSEQLHTPPDWLINDVAVKEWKRVIKELESIDMIGNLDVTNIGGYCNAYALYLQATKALQGKTLVGKADSSGKIQENPFVNVQRKYSQEMREFAKLCGLTIDSRLKFASAKLDETEEKITEEFGDI